MPYAVGVYVRGHQTSGLKLTHRAIDLEHDLRLAMPFGIELDFVVFHGTLPCARSHARSANVNFPRGGAGRRRGMRPRFGPAMAPIGTEYRVRLLGEFDALGFTPACRTPVEIAAARDHGTIPSNDREASANELKSPSGI